MPQERKSFWDSMYCSGKDYRFIHNQTLQQIIQTADVDGDNALDIGCGTGQLTRELYHLGFGVTGVDISAEAIKAAKSASKYIDYMEMDFESDPAENLSTGKFDLIICKLVFAFVEKPEAFIEQVKKLLRNNGAFVIISRRGNK
jgi:2-polyprenyl-3-methyl-5-hydroxy-6-metoxy-1,4-benzoquinol methylase